MSGIIGQLERLHNTPLHHWLICGRSSTSSPKLKIFAPNTGMSLCYFSSVSHSLPSNIVGPQMLILINKVLFGQSCPMVEAGLCCTRVCTTAHNAAQSFGKPGPFPQVEPLPRSPLSCRQPEKSTSPRLERWALLCARVSRPAPIPLCRAAPCTRHQVGWLAWWLAQ